MLSPTRFLHRFGNLRRSGSGRAGRGGAGRTGRGCHGLDLEFATGRQEKGNSAILSGIGANRHEDLLPLVLAENFGLFGGQIHEDNLRLPVLHLAGALELDSSLTRRNHTRTLIGEIGRLENVDYGSGKIKHGVPPKLKGYIFLPMVVISGSRETPTFLMSFRYSRTLLPPSTNIIRMFSDTA